MNDRADPGLLRQVLTLHPLAPLPLPAGGALAGRTVLVINGDADFRESVAAAVVRFGGRVADWVDEADRPDRSEPLDCIIDGGLAAGSAITAGVWQEPLDRTLAALRHVDTDWARQTGFGRLHYVAVTWMGGSMGLEFAPDAQPLGGLWAGLAKTLPREFPACDVRVVDLGAVTEVGVAVLTEMLGTDLLEIGAAGGERWTIMPRRCELGAERDAEPIPIGPGDLVLLTGGGRGIGFEFALGMGRSTGCRVVVSGRGDLPADDPAWLHCDDDEFTAIGRRLFVDRDAADPLPAVRRRLAGMRQARELHGNLERARRLGVDMVYESADVAVGDDVGKLVASTGDGLRMVVHNAGIDVPSRLARKTTEQVHAVVAVKVDGFLHLLSATADLPLAMLAAVGSLTGRYGGMPGQTDYAAANDGLARLAMWSARQRRHPVKSLSWPTWDGVGLITNLEAARRFMTPISIPDGVRAWRDEVTLTGTGEIGFMGEIGDVDPQHLRGIVVPSDWSGRSEFVTRRFLLGEVHDFVPGRSMTTSVTVDPRWATVLRYASVAGGPAVPVTLLVEMLLAAAGWVVPPSGPRMEPTLIENLRVGPAPVDPGRPVRLVRHARSSTPGDGPVGISVEVWQQTDGPSSRPLLVACGLVRVGEPGRSEPLATAAPDRSTRASSRTVPANGSAESAAAGSRAYRWNPALTESGRWSLSEGARIVDVPRAQPNDMFSLVHPPVLMLPVTHLETLVAATPGDGDVWHVERLVLGPVRSIEARRVHLDLVDGLLEIRSGGAPEAVLVSAIGAAWTNDMVGPPSSCARPSTRTAHVHHLPV